MPRPLRNVERTSPAWLRILEMSAGLLILALCVILWWPGLKYGMAFYASLALALIILESVHVVRIYASISARSSGLVLSVVAIIVAAGTLAALPFLGAMTIVYILAIGLLFAGIAFTTNDKASGKITGTLIIFISLVIFVSPNPKIEGIFAILVAPVAVLFPDFYVSEVSAALITLSLVILALEQLISGMCGW